MAKKKKKLKPNLRPGSPWSTKYEVGTHQERRKAVVDRIAATKKNSKKKTIRAKYAKPKETAESVAKDTTAAREATRKTFERWLNGDEVSELLTKSSGCRRLITGLVSAYLREDVIDELKEALKVEK